jgi:hypothetical protein
MAGSPACARLYERRMAQEDPAGGDRRAYAIWLVGAAALAAWFALLWLMFGDVL